VGVSGAPVGVPVDLSVGAVVDLVVGGPDGADVSRTAGSAVAAVGQMLWALMSTAERTLIKSW